MKKLIRTASLAAIGFAVTAFVAPNTTPDNQNFEGVVTYSVSVDNPQLAASMGTSVKVYIKGSKTKTIQDGQISRTIFADRSTTDQPTVLLDIMGNKYQLKNDPKKKEDKDPVIKYVDGTKTILGYTCHKAEITSTDMQGQPSTFDVYYTEDITTPPAKSGPFKSLKGFPLEYSTTQQAMDAKITFTATKIDKQTVPDNTFTIPSGYKLMTMDQIRDDLQKNANPGQ